MLSLASGQDEVALPTVTALSFDPSYVEFNTINVPSVTIRFTINDTTFVSGRFEAFGVNSVLTKSNIVEVKDGSTTFQVCSNINPLSKCGGEGNNPAICPTFIEYMFNGTNLQFPQDTLSKLANITVLYDITPPTLNSIQFANTTTSYYVRADMQDTESGIQSGNGKTISKRGSMDSIDFYSYNRAFDGLYYTSSTPVPSNFGNELVFDRFAPRDNLYNDFLYYKDTVKQFNASTIILRNGAVFNASAPILKSAVFTNNVITDCTVTQFVSVDFVLEDCGPNFVLKSVTPSGYSSTFTCVGVQTGSLSGSVYCHIPPYSANGSFPLTITITDFYGTTSLIDLKGSINYTNANTEPMIIKSQSFNIQVIDKLPKFNLVWNVSFECQPGTLFRSIDVPYFFEFSQSDLVEGTLEKGVLSRRVTFDSSRYDLTVSKLTTWTSAMIEALVETNSVPTTKLVYPSFFMNVDSIELSTYELNTINNTMAFDFTITTPYAIQQASLGMITIPATIGSIHFANKQGYLSGTETVGRYYARTSIANPMSASPGDYLPRVAPGYSQNLYSMPKCINFQRSTKDIASQVVSFQVIPSGPINVETSNKLVTFIIAVNNSLVVPNTINLSAASIGTTSCYQQSANTTTTVFTCSMLIYASTTSIETDISMVMYSLAGSVPYSPALLYFYGHQSRLVIVGKPAAVYARPTITSFTYDSTTKALSLAITPAYSSISQVRVQIVDLYTTNTDLLVQTTFQAPSTSYNTTTILTPEVLCKQTYRELFPIGYSVTVVDASNVNYVYPWAQLKTLFPQLALPSYTCDNVAPILEKYTIGSSSLDTTNGAISTDILFTVTDNQSGLDSFTVVLSTVNTQLNFTYTVNASHLVSGSANNGVYKLSITFPKYTSNSYYVSIPTMSDKQGNTIAYNVQDLLSAVSGSSALSLPIVTFYASTGGPNPITVTPPVLLSHTAKTTVNEGELFELTLTTNEGVTDIIVDFTESNNPGRVSVQPKGTATTITYKPSAFGSHAYFVTLVGMGRLEKIYSFVDGLQPFVYTAVARATPSITSLGATVTADTMTATLKLALTNTISGICYAMDVNSRAMFSASMTFTSTGVASCSIIYPRFSNESTTLQAFLSLTPYTGSARLISAWELENTYGIISTFTAITPPLPTPSPSEPSNSDDLSSATITAQLQSLAILTIIISLSIIML
eukprot:gene15401-18265_t